MTNPVSYEQIISGSISGVGLINVDYADPQDSRVLCFALNASVPMDGARILGWSMEVTTASRRISIPEALVSGHSCVIVISSGGVNTVLTNPIVINAVYGDPIDRLIGDQIGTVKSSSGLTAQPYMTAGTGISLRTEQFDAPVADVGHWTVNAVVNIVITWAF